MLLVGREEIAADVCLDAVQLRELLQSHPIACGKTITAVRIDKVRRYASRRRNPLILSVCYDVDVFDAGLGTRNTHALYGKVYKDRQSAEAARTPTAVVISACNLVLWRWPDDPSMPQLKTLLDPDCVRAVCGTSASTVTVLNYVPEQRATVRYTLSAPSTPSAECVYAKSFADECGVELERRFRHFWDRARVDDTLPLVAEPLGFCAQTRSFWQRQAPGVRLTSMVEGAPPVLGAAIARALSAIHSAPPDLASDEVRDADHWSIEIGRRIRKIGRALPAAREMAARVGDRLAAQAACHRSAPRGLIHGDFHPEQLWVASERIVLFDFDEFCVGDPMEDLAALFVKLRDVDQGRSLSVHVAAAYRALEPTRYCPVRLHWFMGLQSLLLASRAFVFQVPDWETRVEKRLLDALETLSGRLDGAFV